MMCRIAYFVVSVLALGAIGCSSDNRQQDRITATKVAMSPVVEQPKPNPPPPAVSTATTEPPATSVSAIPAKSTPKASTYKVRHAVAAPTMQCAAQESRACELAMEILNVPSAERLAWAKQEFAKREIRDVHDDQ